MNVTINRRNALRSGLGLAGSMLLLARGSQAFANEVSAPAGIVFPSPCQGTGRHPAILSSLRQHLQANGAEGSASQSCPYCQCQLTVTRK